MELEEPCDSRCRSNPGGSELFSLKMRGKASQAVSYYISLLPPGIELWAYLTAQSVKNLPAMQETQVRFPGREDPLEKGKATHSSTLAWRIPGICKVHGIVKSRTRLNGFHSLSYAVLCFEQLVNQVQ